MIQFWFYANGLNLRLHSHEFLFPANESQTAFPWVQVPIPLPMNLRLHSHESLFPCQWISGCIPMSSYSSAKFLESFGWVPPMSYHPTSGMPLGFHQLRPERDFGCTPYNHTWVPIKSIVEHFRCLLRDFCFWAIFRFSESKKSWSSTR